MPAFGVCNVDSNANGSYPLHFGDNNLCAFKRDVEKSLRDCLSRGYDTNDLFLYLWSLFSRKQRWWIVSLSQSR